MYFCGSSSLPFGTTIKLEGYEIIATLFLFLFNKFKPSRHIILNEYCNNKHIQTCPYLINSTLGNGLANKCFLVVHYMVFNNLHYLIDKDFLFEAFNRTRKDGAPGVD